MNTPRHLLSVAACAAALLLSTQAAAQSWPSLDRPTSVERGGENDVAVLVGIEDYTYLPDVDGAAVNLADWERFLRQDLGLTKVMVLRDENATREEILRMADRAAAETREDGKLWFVFIGHGAPQLETGEPLLVGVDGQGTPNSVSSRGVKHAEILARLEAGKQSNTVTILDACFSGRDANGDAILEGVQPVVPTQLSAASSRTTLLSAAAPDQVAGALPGVKRPAFSYLVLGAMRGWADGGDGTVTAAEAVEFSRVELLGVPGRDQTPAVIGDSSLVLTRGATEKRPQILLTGTTTAPAVDTTPAKPTSDTTPGIEKSTDDVIKPQEGDGEFDLPLFARIGIGTSGTPNSPAQDLAGNLAVGWKFDGPGAFEWRAVANVHFSSYRPFSVGDDVTVTFEDMSTSGTIEEGNPLLNRQTSLIAASLGPGFAWRSEGPVGTQLDSVISAEAFGLVGYVENYCDPDKVTVTSGGSIGCDVHDPLTAGLGARLGYTWKFLDVGFSATYAFASDDLVFNTTFGLALDP